MADQKNDGGDSRLQALFQTEPWDWPEDTNAYVVGILRDRGALEPDRIKAAHIAGDMVVVDDEAAEALLAVVSDAREPDGLRAQSAIALGPALEDFEENNGDFIEEPAISEHVFRNIDSTFRRVYNDPSTPKEVRRRVLEAAVRATQEWHSEAVRRAFAEDDIDWTVTALFCAGNIDAFQEEVLKALESDDDDILFEAVRAAGNLELQEAWPRVAQILESPSCDKELLLAALEAAPSVGQEVSMELIAQYLDHEDEEIADAAQEALVFIGDNDGDFEDEEDDLKGEDGFEDEEDK